MNLLRYGIGPTVFLQAIVMTALNIIGVFFATGGLQLSIAYVLLIIIWFGFITVLAYAAEQRRSRGLAILLACVEAIVALVALFNLFHFNNAIGLITSLCDLALALTVLLLAYHLIRRGNARVSKSRVGRASHVPKQRQASNRKSS